jgi:hypothetical protein
MKFISIFSILSCVLASSVFITTANAEVKCYGSDTNDKDCATILRLEGDICGSKNCLNQIRAVCKNSVCDFVKTSPASSKH